MQIALFLIIVSPYTAFLPLIYMTYKWGVQKKTMEWNLWEISLGMLGIISIVAAIVNQSMPSLVGSVGLLFYAGTALYLYQSFADEKQVKELLLQLWPLAFLVGILGIIEKSMSYVVDMTWVDGLFWTPSYTSIAENYRIFSTFGNPNVAGTWFAWMVLVSIFLWETEKEKRNRFLAGAAVFSAALLFTGSRGAIVGLLASLAVYALISRNKGLQKGMLVFIGGLALIAFLSPEVNRVLNNRSDLWMKSIQLIEERPLSGWGIWGGMDNFGDIHSCNAWLSLLLFFGIPGLVVYGLWKGSLYKGLTRLYAGGSKMSVLLISSQVLFVIHGMVDFTAMLPQTGALFFGLCGITAGLMEKTAERLPLEMEEKHKGYYRKRRGLGETGVGD